jgi:hypothetical protein
MDALLETEAVTAGLAARFVLGAAGLGPEGLSGTAAINAAYQEALSRDWLRQRTESSGPEDEISLRDTAFLVMNVFDFTGGVMYTVFRNPRYAYREMLYRKLITGPVDENMRVSGERLLQIIGRTLNYSGEREEMDAMILNSGVFN